MQTPKLLYFNIGTFSPHHLADHSRSLGVCTLFLDPPMQTHALVLLKIMASDSICNMNIQNCVTYTKTYSMYKILYIYLAP